MIVTSLTNIFITITLTHGEIPSAQPLFHLYRCEKHASPPGLEPSTKLRRRPMKKHAPPIQVSEGNHRGQTNIYQDTKTIALIQLCLCEKHASPPGLEPWADVLMCYLKLRKF